MTVARSCPIADRGLFPKVSIRDFRPFATEDFR
jgi:hypothetical protein